MSTEAKCPFTHTAAGATTNSDWWPNQLNLKILHQHSPLSDPISVLQNPGLKPLIDAGG